jgi:putative methyltransferase (TIGR04325 family)
MSHLRVPAHPSYERAIETADSYEDPELVELVAARTGALRASIARDGIAAITPDLRQHMLALSHAAGGTPIDVIELGGACGATYFQLRHLLPECIRRWTVVETPAMAATGRRFEGSGLGVTDRLESTADLVMAIGVVACTPDPIATMRALQETEARCIYLSRTEVGGSRPLVTARATRLVDHGPGEPPSGIPNRKLRITITILPERALREGVEPPYRLRWWFEEGQSKTQLIGRHPVRTRMVGLLLERND